ncbi:hypothetical protein [Vibrio sp. LaRot3]|uniref:hypothetical protein n=1 Tax=Vibrio sp. LaRot3 TaxID=2998829 RepID=UPI0022CE0B58|nr:hypothetical protein [Vibrio sp. LaRot3]MDA0149116.1 hypothetical protein [Vibrio sp. LaRot3]
MKKTLLFFGLLMGSSTALANIHISPEVRLGPYFGSGISGGGLQLGLTDILGTDALYLSHSHLSAEFITDKDRIKTYRLGAQYDFSTVPSLGFQVELGMLEYEGSRTILNTQTRSGTGISSAFAWVYNVNSNLGVRAGMDINYIDKSKSFLSSDLSATFNAGVILHF